MLVVAQNCGCCPPAEESSSADVLLPLASPTPSPTAAAAFEPWRITRESFSEWAPGGNPVIEAFEPLCSDCLLMEDPEARRARLKAMREQAGAVSQSSSPSPEALATKLANPFEEPPPSSDAHTPRFNYYSNPAAGFVPTKRKEPALQQHQQHQQQHVHTTWRPQFHSPMIPMAPSQVGGFGSPIPLYHPQSFAAPGEGAWPIKRPNFGPGRDGGQGGFGGRGSGPARGRGSGFGRNEGDRGRGRGRGRGDEQASARDRPDLFYQKSMVEDPWRNLL